jgi:hypothetical protein
MDMQLSSRDDALSHYTLLRTKFFTWGQNGPGRWMQDFLHGGENQRLGDYTELQIGPVATQMQTFPLPRRSALEWTDYYQAAQLDKTAMHASEYMRAIGAVKAFMISPQGVDAALLKRVDGVLASLADRQVLSEEIVRKGMPWGALEQMLMARDEKRGKTTPLAPGLLFELDEDDEEARPWLELVRDGSFSNATLASALPLSYQTTARWVRALEKSAESRSTWLHHLYLGVAEAEAGDVEGPRAHFEASLALRADNPIAMRCLALLETEPELAYQKLEQAWKMALASTDKSGERLRANLGVELANFITGMPQSEMRIARLEALLAAVPIGERVAQADGIIMARMRVQLARGGQFEAVLSTLGAECFPTIASERTILQVSLMRPSPCRTQLCTLRYNNRHLTKARAHEAPHDHHHARRHSGTRRSSRGKRQHLSGRSHA